ncbi:MAG TPA: hypothetical protein VK980_11535 [Sphingomonas sp.]|nr:hypothetical protein [Sphingomonas sp.]
MSAETRELMVGAVIAQSLSFVMLIEFIAFRTAYSFLAMGFVVLILGGYGCMSCGASAFDKRTVGTKVPFSPTRFHRCGACDAAQPWRWSAAQWLGQKVNDPTPLKRSRAVSGIMTIAIVIAGWITIVILIARGRT